MRAVRVIDVHHMGRDRVTCCWQVGDVLIDSGTRLDQGRVLRDLQGRDVNAHALTHAHFDHYGSSHAVCEQLGVPMRVFSPAAPAVVPPAKVRDFHFTSLADAV